ncbi:MAG: hypothetical protein IH840_14205, partial [Candidatus Heimdallarchaeota archaeon]|nr:hypothetical protein [Candidatus Heimdallarchaeota archaeon]
MSELKTSLGEDAAEIRIKRYFELFPELIDKYVSEFDMTPDEASHSLYISDYVITGTELPGLEEDERKSVIFASLVKARENAKIPVSSQIQLILTIQNFVHNLKKTIYIQSQKGYPIKVIKIHVINSFIKDFLDSIVDEIGYYDFRWILAQIEGSYYLQLASNRYEQITQLF